MLPKVMSLQKRVRGRYRLNRIAVPPTVYVEDTHCSHLSTASTLASSPSSKNTNAQTSFLPALGLSPSLSQKRSALGSTWMTASDLATEKNGGSSCSSAGFSPSSDVKTDRRSSGPSSLRSVPSV